MGVPKYPKSLHITSNEKPKKALHGSLDSGSVGYALFVD